MIVQDTWQNAIDGLRKAGQTKYADRLVESRNKSLEDRRYLLRNVLQCLRWACTLNKTLSEAQVLPLLHLVQSAYDAVPIMRNRDGKQVRVPEQWVGKFPTHLTKMGRKERATEKRKGRRKQLRDEARFDAKQRSS